MMKRFGSRAALSGNVNPAFQAGASFLRTLGLENQAEIARILDIAMNPNSLFVSFRDKKRASNGSVRSSAVTLCWLQAVAQRTISTKEIGHASSSKSGQHWMPVDWMAWTIRFQALLCALPFVHLILLIPVCSSLSFPHRSSSCSSCRGCTIQRSACRMLFGQ
jgi:hypothetical protein